VSPSVPISRLVGSDSRLLIVDGPTGSNSPGTADRGGALKQNLVRSVLLSRQPFKGFIRKQAGNEGVNDLLQREHEQAARRVLHSSQAAKKVRTTSAVATMASATCSPDELGDLPQNSSNMRLSRAVRNS
jgi:hypothetical protein